MTIEQTVTMNNERLHAAAVQITNTIVDGYDASPTSMTQT